MIQGTELRYSDIEKAGLAIMVITRRLRHNFLAHKVIGRTHLSFKLILGKSNLSGRMVKWALDLSEYDVYFESIATIKA